jgi:hypothetical protein
LQQRLVESAAGILLLSTLPADRRDGVLRRLNAEAGADQKFNLATMRERVETCARQGQSVGAAGFSGANMCAVLAPMEPGERPLALGFVYDAAENADEVRLIALLRQAVERCTSLASGRVSQAEALPGGAER